MGRRRDDGYHEIESVMQAVSLSDRIEIEEARGVHVACDDPAVPDGPGNIAHAAARLLAAEAGIDRGCRIHIDKGIPVAAGLGGGSGNAAAVLAGLCALWGLEIPPEKLMELGGRLGSDVPFFFVGGTAICRGRGEIVEPVAPIPPNIRFLLVTPEVEISSSLAYKELNRLRLTKDLPFSKMKNEFGFLWNPDAWDQSLFNRLEESILPAFPIVKATIERVAQYCDSGAIMSGSGPTVFGILGKGSEDSADELLSRFDNSRNVAVVHPMSCGFRLENSSET